MALTTCLDCGTPSRGWRCGVHAAEHRAYKNAVYGDPSHRGARAAMLGRPCGRRRPPGVPARQLRPGGPGVTVRARGAGRTQGGGRSPVNPCPAPREIFVNPVSAPAWRNRIVGSGEEAPDQLATNPANWRTHPGLQRDALRGSLSEVGWVQQVMVNRRAGFVVDGHARVEEALSRHEPTVPVLYVDLSEDEERLVLATLDPLARESSSAKGRQVSNERSDRREELDVASSQLSAVRRCARRLSTQSSVIARGRIGDVLEHRLFLVGADIAQR